MFDPRDLELLAKAASKLGEGFASLPEFSSQAPELDRIDEVLSQTAHRLRDTYPYFHPLYAGQMLKPPHPVARLAYAMAMNINPNNHALDGGRATSAMEKEAVAEIATMFGFKEHLGHLGHLCGGGTMANLEALWVAGQLHPGKIILASEQAHYTHQRISATLQLACESVSCDGLGRMDINALEDRLKQENIGTVVATLGTTATGSVDPLPEIIQLQQKYGFRIHADAAYGGYYVLARNLEATAAQAFSRVSEVDSIVVDPHKHGLQPYGCGCVLFRDPSVGRLYKHDSPYTYFSSAELHLGEISLECSRPGAAAAALWATQKLLPLVFGGKFALSLQSSRDAALAFYQRLQQSNDFVPAFAPELDIVIFAPQAPSATESSKLSRKIFEESARHDLHLALAQLPAKFWRHTRGAMHLDSETITCLRSVLMKPEHLDWIGPIWDRLQSASNAVRASKRAVQTPR
ncbi:MAG TPA: aminotransferase class I/II-fold pyridoxal phosphate-dependent enzyme [Candidatus Dormibacteraeota bacterium]|nr:aminotransferase class I/II-fold pyridoxal phosphate-dependent enzyme [Candidatus Dormibacteraeota bacterium]